MLISKDLSLARYSNLVTNDGRVKLQWHVTSEGRVFLDKSPKEIILCALHVKTFLNERDQAKLGAVCRSLRRAYSIKQQGTVRFLNVLHSTGAFTACFSYLKVDEYTNFAKTSRFAQYRLGRGRHIRSVHLVNKALSRPLIAGNINFNQLISVIQDNRDKIAPHLLQFARANLGSIVEMMNFSFPDHKKIKGRALIEAASENNLSMILNLFISNAIVGTNFEIAISIAAERGYVSCVRLLMNKTSYIDTPFDQGLEPALIAAASKGEIRCLQTLLDSNNLPTHGGLTISPRSILSNPPRWKAIGAASNHNQVEALRILLEDSFKIMDLENTIVHAAKLGHLACFRILFGKPKLEEPCVRTTFQKAINAARHIDFFKGILAEYEYLIHDLIQRRTEEDRYHVLRDYINLGLSDYVIIALKHEISPSDIKKALRLAVFNGHLKIVNIFFKEKREISKSILEELIPISEKSENQKLTEFLISQNEIG